MAVDLLKQTLRAGIPPLEMEYRPVKTTGPSELSGYQGVLKINSIELGVLYPAQYRVVTNRNQQCVRLATWAFRQVCADLTRLLEQNRANGTSLLSGSTGFSGFVSAYFPTKMLMRGDVAKMLTDLAGQQPNLPAHLCLEFSSDLLLEDTAMVSKQLELCKKTGALLMLSEFGDAFCPVLRIGGLPFDFAVLDKQVSTAQALSGEELDALLGLLRKRKIASVLEQTDSSELVRLAFRAGCTHFIDRKSRRMDEVMTR